MRQFEAFSLVDRSVRAQRSLVVLLQADATNQLGTLIVAPLKPQTDLELPILHVSVTVDGAPFFARVNELAAIAPKNLGSMVADLSADEAVFKRAIDFLFFGI